ncbi:MAG TPA: 50S ribosomal protein L32 [Fimbriimonadales bacterium]|nr:50S ribosomal protein L32 [Fimbriimonadales bacterium]
MPNPKRKHSHARSAKRRGNWRTKAPELVLNRVQGGERFILAHNASPDGFYKGRRLPGFKEK